MNEALHARIWNTHLQDGRVVKATTIEHGTRSENPMCLGCWARCCRGTNPVLTAEEFTSNKYRYTFISAPNYIKDCAPANRRKGLLLVTIPNVGGNCFYLDSKTYLCRTWPDIPKACQTYDCRKDDRPEFRNFMVQRTQEWMQQRKAV